MLMHNSRFKTEFQRNVHVWNNLAADVASTDSLLFFPYSQSVIYFMLKFHFMCVYIRFEYVSTTPL